MKLDLKNVFGFVPFVLAIILTSVCVTTSGAKESHQKPESNSVEIFMKGRVIIQGVDQGGIPSAMVEYENKLYTCHKSYIDFKHVARCWEVTDKKQ